MSDFAVVTDDGLRWCDTLLQAEGIAIHEIRDLRERSKRDGVWDGWTEDVENVRILRVTHRATLLNPADHYSRHEYAMLEVPSAISSAELAGRYCLRGHRLTWRELESACSEFGVDTSGPFADVVARLEPKVADWDRFCLLLNVHVPGEVFP